jgi:hypothetical protein
MSSVARVRSRLIPVLFALGALLAAPAAVASDDGHDDGSEGGHGSYHPNYLAVFVGVTDEDRRERASTLGIEYERRLSESFGIGGIIEHAYGDLDFTIYAIPFAYHSGRWKWYVAPGIENPDKKPGTEFLLRVGLEYFFKVGAYEMAPQFDVDFVDGETVLVLGLTVGRGF